MTDTPKYLAFDLEIAALLPDGETDWKAHRPLGITCASLRWDHQPCADVTAACERNLHMHQGDSWDSETLLPRMTQSNARALIRYMSAAVRTLDVTVITWNGLGFDFDVLAEEVGNPDDFDRCRKVALFHVDPMFQFFCYQGYPVGLDAVSKGMGLSGKTEGMSGALAPQMWAEGRYQEVLDYVAQDANATLEVVQAIERTGGIYWITRQGRRRFCPFPDGLLTVAECLELPEPDNSWMTEPMTRDKFTAWMQPELAGG